eukprot:4680085-Alexandrium_andersonii.AAC.1
MTSGVLTRIAAVPRGGARMRGWRREVGEHAQMLVTDATLTQGLGGDERARHPEYVCTAGASTRTNASRRAR